MSTAGLYDKIHTDSIQSLAAGQVESDPFLVPGVEDRRMGVTLVVPVTQDLARIGDLIDRFSHIEPGQYAYPVCDLHITVFDLIAGTDLYLADPAAEAVFLALCQEALRGAQAFSIDLRGVVFSKGAGLICGYDNDSLVDLRASIRSALRERGLPNTERYESHSAHITFMRFAQPLASPSRLVQLIHETRSLEIGKLDVGHLELVEHDWYNRASRRRLLGTFQLES
jgi:2'-5' RNA ligase